MDRKGVRPDDEETSPGIEQRHQHVEPVVVHRVRMTTTGISADDRTLTVRNLANGNVGGSDFVRPGHIFPLVAREGGVLMRSGHTEAAVDLCKLAGLPQVGVISELVNEQRDATTPASASAPFRSARRWSPA